MLSESQSEFWRKVQPGWHLVLSDWWKSMQDSHGTDTPGSMTYKVTSVLSVHEVQNLCEWIFIELESSKRNLTLVVKLVDEEVDLKLFYVALAAGNRREAFADFNFLFADVAEGTDVLAMTYADAIENNRVAEDGMETKLLYAKKQVELSARCAQNPVQSGISNLFATVAEYGCTTEFEEPELLILELGRQENPDGGYIKMYQGVSLLDSRVEVLEAV